MATTITLNATGLPSYLNNSTYQGSFNGSAVLPGSFTINSIGFTFMFADDATDPFSNSNGTSVTTSSVSTDHLPTGDKDITTTNTVTTPVTRTGEHESVALSFGSFIFSGATAAGPALVASNTLYGPRVLGSVTYEKGNGNTCTAEEVAEKNQSCKKISHYTITNTVNNTTTTDFIGGIALGGSLLAYDSLLADLLQNQFLNFSLGATGDLNLVSASLNLDYTNTDPALPSNSVPEPGSLALFGIALIGAAGARRARRC